jgi:UDP-N-acetylmuramate dehydrogenase
MTVAIELERLDALAAERGIALQRGVALGPWTTLRVGGAADRVAAPRSIAELVATLEIAGEAGIRPFVLGKGSDVVVADAGIRGLVIRNRADRLHGVGQPPLRWIVASGTPMAKLVKHFTSIGLTGLEFGISIPGTVGGAAWANAGAHDGEMRDVIRRVEVYDLRDGTRRELDAADCAFAYRESRFKHAPEIILEVTLAVAEGDATAVAERVAAHQAQRRATQPLADQNAGSVFRNPPDDHAGRLIDAAGLKGFRIGSAQVSTLHANFIVADRGGKAADVRAVGDHVRAIVADRFGVELAYEIEFVGEWARGGDDG